MASTNARQLRGNATDAERRLWSALRRRRPGGHRFRRQVPLGLFIADFVCFSARLVIEVDGGQHGEREVEDDRRTAWLERQSFRVVRFRNNEVLGTLESVLTTIAIELGVHPPP